MILQIIQLLLISLGFQNNNNTHNNNNTPRSLYPKQTYQPVHITIHPILLIILMAAGMIMFAMIIFMFMPGTESGLVYNHPGY